MELWKYCMEITSVTEMKGRIHRCRNHNEKFNFAFGCDLSAKILKQTDNLSKTIQQKELSAVEAQELANAVIKTLVKYRCD